MEIRTDLLKFIVQQMNPEKYLEIGIQEGINFESIKVNTKIGVEPNPRREP